MTEIEYQKDGYQVEQCVNPETWNRFIKRNDGPVYALWGWGDAVETYGHDRWYLVVRSDATPDSNADNVVAALPLFHIDSTLFGSQLISPPFAERGSVIVSDAESEAAVQLLLERAIELGEKLEVDFVSLRGSRVDGPDPFSTENRYMTFQVSTYRGQDSIWADVKSSRRRQIRQARDDNSLNFRVGDSIEDLRAYYSLYLQSMREHGSPAHSFEFFHTLWDQLADSGNLRLSMIEKDGSLINGMIDLSAGSTVYQWGVVTDREYRDLNGGSWILWKSLEWASESGYDTYEFGRTREGSGVYMFKKSFGGSKVWYDDLIYLRTEAATPPRPDADKYEQMKKVWRRLPIPVTRVVGPRVRKRIGL